jgi:hypothetical protein
MKGVIYVESYMLLLICQQVVSFGGLKATEWRSRRDAQSKFILITWEEEITLEVALIYMLLPVLPWWTAN